MESFFDIARVLTENSECTLMGSLCLYLTVPSVLGREVHDVDLFADDDPQNLRNIMTILKERGFELYSWQNRITPEVDLQLLRGRYYFRAVKDGLTVDVTYEKPEFTYQDMKQYETVSRGIRIYSARGLVRLLSCSDREENRVQLERLLTQINNSENT